MNEFKEQLKICKKELNGREETMSACEKQIKGCEE
jgi:hypothetical protein